MNNAMILKHGRAFLAAGFATIVALLVIHALLSHGFSLTHTNNAATVNGGVCGNNVVYTTVDMPERRVLPVVEYDGVWYNETTVDTMQHFINNLAPCPYPGACGITARYIRVEAEKVNLSIREITIRDRDRARVKSTLMDGHRVNVFIYDGTRYYTVNLYAGDTRITTIHGLRQALTDAVW